MHSEQDTQEAPKKVRRTGRTLCYVGWGLFALSMFLPAMEPIFSGAPFLGWQCAWVVLWGVLTQLGQGFPLYYASFAAGNLLLASSPLLLRKSLTAGKPSKVLVGLLVVSALNVLWLATAGGWLIGYYVWLASYLLVAAGSLCLLKAESRKPEPLTATAGPRTPAEVAAERELETYLRQ